MEGTARIWFTPQQRAELWERWKNGQCVADIARALARRNKSGVYRVRQVPIGRERANRRDIAMRRRDDADHALRGGPEHAVPFDKMVLAQSLGDENCHRGMKKAIVALARRLDPDANGPDL